MTEEVEHHIYEKFEIIQKLGMGAYGVVWKAKKRSSGEVVALKKVFDAFHNKTDAQRTYREVMILQGLKGHSNITQLIGIIRAKNNKDIYMVFKYMKADLHAVIKSKLLKEIHFKYVIYQTLKGLKFIHSGEIIHRDLKPSNILIDESCKIQIADFGLARSISKENGLSEEPILTEYIATRWYRAPEIVLGSQKYTKAVDVWSVGCILGEMFHGKAIFPGKSTLNQVELILRLIGVPGDEDLESMDCQTAWNIIKGMNVKKFRDWDRFFNNYSQEGLHFIKCCLQFNPQKRYTIDQLLSHPYLKEFKDSEPETTLSKPILLKIDDSTKLNIKDYRDALYKDLCVKKKLNVIKSLKKSNLKFKKKIGTHGYIGPNTKHHKSKEV